MHENWNLFLNCDCSNLIRFVNHSFYGSNQTVEVPPSSSRIPCLWFKLDTVGVLLKTPKLD